MSMNRQFMAHTAKPASPRKQPALRDIPKAELHLHLEGSMSPSLINKLATQHKLTLDLAYSEDGKRILWTDFMNFLAKYDEASRIACTVEALEEITYDYLRHCHGQGSIYNELTVSPDHLARFGLSYAQAITATENGIRKAKQEFDIDANIIIVILRHGNTPDFSKLEESRKNAQQQAMQLLDSVLSHSFDHVVAVGLAGAEDGFPPELFVEAFKRAGDAGLGLTAHAGEWTNAEDVRKAIDLLKVTRVGHGIHAAFNPELVAALKERCIHLELCPHSNFSLNTKQNYPDSHKDISHPVSIFHEAGISYSLNSDDPPFFGTELLKEYEYVMKTLDLDVSGLLQVTLNAINASFASNALKETLRAKINQFAEKHEIDINKSFVTNRYA